MDNLEAIIQIGNLQISEPVTVLTDSAVAIACFIFARMLKTQSQNSKKHRFIRYYFIALGIGTGISGFLGHGLGVYLDTAWKIPGWMLCSLAVAWINQATLYHNQHLLSKRAFSLASWSNVAIMVICSFLSVYYLKFLFVLIYLGITMVFALLLLNGIQYRQNKNKASLSFIYSVLVIFVMIPPYLSKWSPSIWFTYHDVGHIFMIINAYFIYQAASRMKIKKSFI